MIWQKLLKVGNNYVVTVPKEEVERLQLQEGQLLSVEIHAAEKRAGISSLVSEAFEESWERNEAGYRYLADK